MFTSINSIEAKRLIIVLLIILIGEFSFPYQATASEIKIEPSIFESTQINFSIAKEPPVLHLPEIPDRPQPEAKRSLKISVTAYSSTPDQTSGDPLITASGSRVRDGIIAANFLPIGTKVRFPEKYGNKIFIVEDRMHQRYWQRADIWMETRDAAKQ
ncbi:3D domain-containing protein, partial [Patescibacteria group bacterium]|nr:3D domain-containing protein [Patescibacteria group bacterium]